MLLDGEEWLIQRVIDYATELGYAKHASPLREAWRVAVRGLMASFIEELRLRAGDLEIHADEDVREDSAVGFGIREARLHRSRGVDLGMFLGLMKYNEQAFADFISESVPDGPKRRSYYQLVRRFFDRMQIGFTTEWAGLSAVEAVDELRERNLLMTSEKDLYLRFFETIGVPLIVLDLEGRIKNLNERAAVVFGIEGVTGSAYYSQVGIGTKFTPLAEELERFIASGAADMRCDRTLETTDGLRHFMIRIQGLTDVTGACNDIVIVMGDMTDRRQLEMELEQQVAERTEALERTNEELLRANEVKSEFLAAMSHELRTPLNSILGFSTVLLQGLAGPVNDEQERQLGMIVSSGQHLLRLVNDVLDLSTLEAGQPTLVLTEFDVADLCESMAAMLRPLAEEKQVDLKCGSGCRELVVYSDRDKVMQILLNLTSNALKFTDEGEVSICCGRDDVNGLALVAVSDSGCGISPEDTERVFDEFWRGGSYTARSGDGNGLGLAISRRLARMLNGDIILASTPGEGSKFTLMLPTGFEEATAEAS